MESKNYEILHSQDEIKLKLTTILNYFEKQYNLSQKLVGIVPILNGAWFIANDLMLALPSKCILEPVKISLYGESFQLNNDYLSKYSNIFKLKPNLDKLSECDIIIIIDDICDTGTTLKIVNNYIKQANKNTLTLTIINVENSKPKIFTPDEYLFIGTKDYWYFGYGMDIKGKYRNLNFIAGLSNRRE